MAPKYLFCVSNTHLLGFRCTDSIVNVNASRPPSFNQGTQKLGKHIAGSGQAEGQTLKIKSCHCPKKRPTIFMHIYVMLTRLQIKRGEVVTSDGTRSRPSYLNFWSGRNWLTYLKSNTKRCLPLALTTTESGLHTIGQVELSTTEWTETSSLTANSTKRHFPLQMCGLADTVG